MLPPPPRASKFGLLIQISNSHAAQYLAVVARLAALARFSDTEAAVLELGSRGLLDAPLEAGHDDRERRESTFSRRMASEFFDQFTLVRRRGRREGRVPFAPMVRVQQKSTRQNHRYEPNNRPSLRNGFNGFLRALPGETGLCSHRRFASSRKARHLHRGARTTRLRRPRHVVRLTTRCVHRIPLPTSVTIAKRPSCGSETRGSSF